MLITTITKNNQIEAYLSLHRNTLIIQQQISTNILKNPLSITMSTENPIKDQYSGQNQDHGGDGGADDHNNNDQNHNDQGNSTSPDDSNGDGDDNGDNNDDNNGGDDDGGDDNGGDDNGGDDNEDNHHYNTDDDANLKRQGLQGSEEHHIPLGLIIGVSVGGLLLLLIIICLIYKLCKKSKTPNISDKTPSMKSQELQANQTPYSVQNLHEYPVIPDNNNNQGHYLEHQAGYPSKSVKGSNVNYYPNI